MPKTNYIWDPLNDSYLMETDETGTPLVVYTQEPSPNGRVISQNRGGVTSYYHFDRLGSTRLLTDDTQTVTDTYIYDAWGTVVHSTGTTVNSFLWIGTVGYYHDLDLGTYYVRLRTFGSPTARWTSLDCHPFHDHINNYLAVLNNPLRFKDSEGATIEEIAKVIESGDWRFRLFAGPSLLTDGFPTYLFNVTQSISLVDFPKNAKQVWQLSLSRRFIQKRSPDCGLEKEEVIKADVFDIGDIPNDGFRIRILDAQGIIPTTPPPGTQGPVLVSGLFNQKAVCQLFEEVFVIIGFDDGKGRLPPRNSMPPRDFDEFQRMVNSQKQGRYSYSYEFRNNCGFCFSCGVQCDCHPHEVITTPWVKATDEDRLPIAGLPKI